MEISDAVGANLGGLAAEVLARPEGVVDGELDAADVDAASMWSLAEAIPIGGTAAVALIEHVWAAPLSAAIQRAGGTLLEETWLARQDVELLESLNARQDQ